MLFKRLVVLTIVLLFSSCTGSGPNDPASGEVGVFEAAPCPVPFPEAENPGEAVKCGYVRVPELHGEPNGKTLRIAVAIFPGRGDNLEGEALVVSPPGPGTSAIANIGPVVASPVGDELRKLKTVVLIENRGLPLSEPALLCEEVVEASFERLQQNLSADEVLELQAEPIRACSERLRKEGVNLDAFNFSQIAADLVMVMKALGYEKFTIFGTSAGTIVAQHVMRSFPENVTSVLIDSTVPLGKKQLQTENPLNASLATKALFAACAEDSACAASYPDLETQFDGIFVKLNEKPVTVVVQDPRNGEDLHVVINGDRLAEILFMGVSQVAMIPNIPALIHALANEDYEVLKSVAWAAMPPPGQFSHGLGQAAICSEFATFGEEAIAFDGSFPNFEKALASMSWGPKAIIKNCAAFDVASTADTARMAVTSDIPTLILTGQFDTMTPPAWSRFAAETLSQSHVFEIPGYGHSATFAGPCPASLAIQFLQDPSKAPDASCVAAMKPAFVPPAG